MNKVEQLPNGIRITTINKGVEFDLESGPLKIIVTRVKVVTTITDEGVSVEHEVTREVSVLR